MVTRINEPNTNHNFQRFDISCKKTYIHWGWNVSLSFKNTSYPSPHPACSAKTRMQPVLPPSRSSSTALEENSATGTRTWVARVRAEYPNQLDYSGHVK